MDKTLVIVDYGAGNLRSVAKALERLGFPALVTQDPAQVLKARGVILPGVGSSGACGTSTGVPVGGLIFTTRFRRNLCVTGSTCGL